MYVCMYAWRMYICMYVDMRIRRVRPVHE